MQSTTITHRLQHLLPHLDACALRRYGPSIVALALLDLEPARAILDRGLSGRGRRAFDQVAMLRGVLLMALLGETSFNRWAPRLRGEPALAIMAGFEPGQTPAIGTFYDFMARVLDGPPPASRDWRRPSARYRRRGRGLMRRLRPASKTQPGRVKQAVGRALGRLGQATNESFSHRLNRILVRCAVRRSVEVGLLKGRLDVAIDGSMIKTQARSLITEEGRAPRGWLAERCADPDAFFGYDSRVDGLLFGHRMHAISASAQGCDLPLWIDVGHASEPDGVGAPRVLSGLHRMLGEEGVDAGMRHVIADSGYDAMALYRFVHRLDARPVIRLNPKNVPALRPDAVEYADDGRPLCPAGAPMRLHQRQNRHGKSVWRCPAKRRHRDGSARFDAAECPNAADCMPQSKQGPWVHLDHRDDPRLNPVVIRGSAEEKRLFKERACVERFFGYVKGFGGLARRPYRRRHVIHVMGLCHALALHAKAWIKTIFGDVKLTDARALRQCLSEIAAAARFAQAG